MFQYDEWKKLNPGTHILDWVFYTEDFSAGLIDKYGKPIQQDDDEDEQ